MRLNYNVLWIDDNIDSLRAYKKALEEKNDQIGIRTKHVDVPVRMGARENPDEHQARVSKDIEKALSDQVFELIVVDLHMTGKNGGFDGPDIIQFIRDTQKIFRPIVFHSGGDQSLQATATEQLNERAEEKGVFGKSIFISPKDRLSNMLSDIVGEMHENEHQINQVRGTLMDCVSEIDAQIIDVMTSGEVWDQVPETSREAALKKFKSLIDSQRKKAEKQHEHVKGMSYDEVREYVLDDPKNVSTFVKTKLLRELAKKIPEIKDAGDTLSAFIATNEGAPECLNEIRNKYAHQTAVQLAANHNDDHCTHIRREAHKHTDNVISLRESLK
ncbi:MAG: hypothetical protein ABJP70_06040 [Erythrobacter sp.]